jgi:hypothetical protein
MESIPEEPGEKGSRDEMVAILGLPRVPVPAFEVFLARVFERVSSAAEQCSPEDNFALLCAFLCSCKRNPENGRDRTARCSVQQSPAAMLEIAIAQNVVRCPQPWII